MRPRLPAWLGRLLAGNRPFAAAVVVVLVVGTLMLARPAGLYLDGRARLDLLEAKREALHGEIGRLEQRETDLTSADHVELLAREQLGLVKPGEVAYIVVEPEPEDRPQVAPAEDTGDAPRPWYRRLLDAVADVIR